MIIETSDTAISLDASNDNADRAATTVRFNSGGVDVYQSSRNRIEENDASENSSSGIGSATSPTTTSSRLNHGELERLRRHHGRGRGARRLGHADRPQHGQRQRLGRHLVNKIGHTVVGNRADNNMGWGIYATVATSLGMNVDGGGNRAEGNKELLQCFMIRCDGTAPGARDVPAGDDDHRGPAGQQPARVGDVRVQRLRQLADRGRVRVPARRRRVAGLRSARTATTTCRRATTCSRCARSTTAGNARSDARRRSEWTHQPLPPGVRAARRRSTPGPTRSPSSTTRDASAFSSNEPGVTFECNLDNAGVRGLRPAQGLRRPGARTAHASRSRAGDAEGLRDGSPGHARRGRSAPAAGGRRGQLRPGADAEHPASPTRCPTARPTAW